MIDYRRRALLGSVYTKEAKNYFTIEALEDGLTAKLSTNACEYCIDNGNWNTLSADTNTPSVNSGQKIQFKLTNPAISSSYGIGTFTISKKCNVSGNIMSLLYGDGFEGQIDLSGKNYAFYKLFNNCTTLQSAENLILSATTLASSCYTYMFYGCSNLTTAPELPATTLASNCYQYMFYGCSNLTTAPELPATTLASYCYHYMFYGCSKLNYIKMLATDISASYCLDNWVNGVASSGTFVKNAAMTTLTSGKNGIPVGWTVEDYVETNLITFTVDGIEYQAEEGMTWEEWVNSEYNTGTFVCKSNNNYVSYQYNGKTTYVATGQYGGRVTKTSIIDPTKNYMYYSSAPA